MTREAMIESISKLLDSADASRLRIIYQFILHLVR